MPTIHDAEVNETSINAGPLNNANSPVATEIIKMADDLSNSNDTPKILTTRQLDKIRETYGMHPGIEISRILKEFAVVRVPAPIITKELILDTIADENPIKYVIDFASRRMTSNRFVTKADWMVKKKQKLRRFPTKP